MKYYAKNGQVIYGEAIGILLLDEYTPHVPGDIANATSFRYPVLFEVVEGLTVSRAVGKDHSAYDIILLAAKKLIRQGVKAVTSNCGFLALHQKQLASELPIPVFLSSLMQISFILSLLGKERSLGIITANSKNLDTNLLASIGIQDDYRLVIKGLENQKHFSEMVLNENGTFDPQEIKREVVASAIQLHKKNPNVGALLLECALFPAYSASVQAATGLLVFDFITMIDYVQTAAVRSEYKGIM